MPCTRIPAGDGLLFLSKQEEVCSPRRITQGQRYCIHSLFTFTFVNLYQFPDKNDEEEENDISMDEMEVGPDKAQAHQKDEREEKVHQEPSVPAETNETPKINVTAEGWQTEQNQTNEIKRERDAEAHHGVPGPATTGSSPDVSASILATGSSLKKRWTAQALAEEVKKNGSSTMRGPSTSNPLSPLPPLPSDSSDSSDSEEFTNTLVQLKNTEPVNSLHLILQALPSVSPYPLRRDRQAKDEPSSPPLGSLPALFSRPRRTTVNQ